MSSKSGSDTIRLLWRVSSAYKWRRNIALCLAILIFCVNIFVIPLIIAQFLDMVQHGRLDENTVWWLVAGYAAAQLWAEVIGWRVVLYLMWTFETAMQRDVHTKIFDKLASETMHFHANRFSGSLVSQASKLSGAIERFWDTIIWSVLPVIISIVGSVVILWFIFWPYALFLAVLSLVFMVAVYFGSRHMLKFNQAEAAASNKVSGRLADTVSNILAVKTSATESTESTEFQKTVGDWRGASLATMKSFLKVSTAYSSISGLIRIGALVFAVLAARADIVSIASIYLIVTYTASVARNLWSMNGIMRSYNRVMGDSHEMTQILKSDISVTDKSSTELVVKSGELSIDSITFTHDEGEGSTLFKDFSLNIEPGQKVGLVGASGSGKTTLTKLLLRLADIDKGAISIDGQNIAQVTQESLRRAIAYVPQEPLLFHRSISENIAYAKPTATKKQIEDAARKAGALNFIRDLKDGFDTTVGERGVKLSGGQRQRIAIARAILKDAPILVLDEATSALDSESEKLIQASLDELMKNRTSIVIAHRLSTIAKLDRIIVLDKGEVVEDGSHTALLKKKGVYANLWSHQSGGFIEE